MLLVIIWDSEFPPEDFLAWELRPSLLDELGLDPGLNKFVGEWSRHLAFQLNLKTWS